MPCYVEPTFEECENSIKSENQKKYGLALSHRAVAAELGNMLCSTCKDLEKAGELGLLNNKTFNWYTEHKQRDQAKCQAQASKLKDQLREAEAKVAELNRQIAGILAGE